jgi:hypothetical protein
VNGDFTVITDVEICSVQSVRGFFVRSAKRRVKKGKDGWYTIPAILIPTAAAVY